MITPSGSLYCCLFAPHIYGCYSLCTSCSWWLTHSKQRQWRGCNSSNKKDFQLCLVCYYNGFTFSHYDLPFPTRYCIPYVKSGLYQLVICVTEFVCARSTAFAYDLDSHCIFGFVHRRGHHALRESSCVSLAHGPRWLFLLSHHRKAFLLLLIRSLL